MRQNTLHLWLDVTRPTMGRQWSRIITARAQQSARSSLKPLLVKADAASEIMVGLKEASNDVRRAADQLVKATKKTPL